MIKKKNGFGLFLCSLIPGAGEMYLGFMKEGISMMGAFTVLFILAVFANVGLFGFALPIVWFYSFFNAHNKAGLSDEEFYSLEDDYLFHVDRLLPDGKLSRKQTVIWGWILILLGVSIIWRPVIRSMINAVRVYISTEIADMIGGILYQMPKYVVAAVLILCGIHMICNKKNELEKEEIQ